MGSKFLVCFVKKKNNFKVSACFFENTSNTNSKDCTQSHIRIYVLLLNVLLLCFYCIFCHPYAVLRFSIFSSFFYSSLLHRPTHFPFWPSTFPFLSFPFHFLCTQLHSHPSLKIIREPFLFSLFPHLSLALSLFLFSSVSHPSHLCHLSLFFSHFHPFFKGTVSRDFLLLVFFMNQFPPSPWVYH